MWTELFGRLGVTIRGGGGGGVLYYQWLLYHVYLYKQLLQSGGSHLPCLHSIQGSC